MNEKVTYDQAVRASLPSGMTYSDARYRYNGVSFFEYVNAYWYYLYLTGPAGGSFSPASLFTDGEAGAWYEPDDLTTLTSRSFDFVQTPATVGSPVWLMLDKSQGITLGTELVSNGTFDTDTGWTKGAGWTISGGSAIATGVAAFVDISQAIGIVSGRFYQVSVDVTVASGSAALYMGTSGVDEVLINLPSTGSYTAKLQAGAAAAILVRAQSLFTGTIDNISVREIPGNYATQATAADRPLYENDGRGYLSNVSSDTMGATMPDLGADATLAYCDQNGVTILSNQTISGAVTLPTSTKIYWAIYLDRALTESERQGVIGYGGDYVADFYANSALGSDAYDGKSPGRAFATISKTQTDALAQGNNVAVGLARGSSWREMLNFSSLTGVKVQGYGPNGSTSGTLPKLDCANVAANASFSKTAARTNVYEISWAHSLSSDIDKTKLRVWSDGARLKWVSSVALCDAEAGTYHVATVASPATIYIHATGSTNPVSDAKTYEITSRDHGLLVGGGYDVRYIHTTRNAHHDGSFVAPAGGVAPGYGEGILSTDGIIHNQWVLPGSTHVRCVAYDIEPSTWRNQNATLFVAFSGTSEPAATRLQDCYAYSAAPAGNSHEAIYAHTVGGAERLGALEVVGCRVYGPSPTISAGDTDAMTVSDTFIDVISGRTNDLSLINCSTGDVVIDNVTAINCSRFAQSALSFEITDARVYTTGAVSGGLIWPAGCVIRNSSFAFTKTDAALDRIMFVWPNGAAAVFEDNIVQNGSENAIAATTAGSITSDRNVIWNENAAGNSFTIRSPESYISFASWQSTTGEDANTSYTNSEAAPIFTDAPVGDFSFASSLPDTGGRTAGSRKTIARPDWATLVTAWQAGNLGI